MSQTWLIVGILSGVVSVGVALYLYFWVLRQDAGSERAAGGGWIAKAPLLT